MQFTSQRLKNNAAVRKKKKDTNKGVRPERAERLFCILFAACRRCMAWEAGVEGRWEVEGTVNEKTRSLGTQPLFPLLISMAIPGLLGTFTTYLYRTVDQIFVGNFVGRNALGGISVLSPFNNIIIALSLFITVGGASMISLAMGKNNYERANKLFSNVVIQAILMAVIVSVCFYVFAEPFVSLCGAKEGTETYEYALIYLKIIVFGQVFNMLNQGLAAIIRAEGAAKYSMFANIIGAVCNVVLDYILVCIAGMGVAGAAIATVASQVMGAGVSAASSRGKCGPGHGG